MAGKRKIGSGRISTSEGKRGYGKGTKIRNWGTDGIFSYHTFYFGIFEMKKAQSFSI